MPTFVYKAINSAGQAIKGQVEATSQPEAITKIRAKGEHPTEVKEKAARKSFGGAKSADEDTKRRTIGRVSNKLLVQFTRQLSTLIDAGLPVLRSLRILEQQQKPGPMRNAISFVGDDVENGKPMSEAMGSQPKVFNRLYCNMIRAGELGGVLDLVLQRLAEFLERSRALKQKVVSAMIYPAVVISFSVLIVLGLMWKVIPKFKDIFSQMDQKLPALTQTLIDISDWVAKGGWMIILLTPVAVIFIIRLVKMTSQGRYIVDLALMNTPIFGPITRKTSVARFSRTLGTLLGAGVPILEALNITHATADNEVFSRAMKTVHDGIREGESFSAPLRQAKIVDPMVVNMIDVGEETGKQDQMLAKIADIYDEEVETAVDGMVSLLEPVMVVVLGSSVAFIVISLFLPMVSMLQGFGG
jgi:type IV pilus assembly protein PilC